VVLYWFTLCFYGYRQTAGRAALRTLFTHEGSEEGLRPAPTQSRQGSAARSSSRKRQRQGEARPTLFAFSPEYGYESPRATDLYKGEDKASGIF
jgi:hypothetical protein